MKTPIRLLILVAIVLTVAYLLVSNLSFGTSQPVIPQSRIPVPNAEAKEVALARQQAAGKSDKLPAEAARAHEKFDNERPDQKLMKGNIQPFNAAAKSSSTVSAPSVAANVTGTTTAPATLPAWATSLAHESELMAAASTAVQKASNGTGSAGREPEPKPLPIDLDSEERLPGFITSAKISVKQAVSTAAP